jgi:transposase
VLAGERHADVANALGVAREVVSKWVGMYHRGGWDALRRTTAPGASPKLTASQEAALFRIIATKSPAQLRFEFALWTREIVQAYILRRWNIRLGLSTVTRLLRRIGLTPQRPMARAIEQDPAAVKAWVRVEFPKIKVLAKKARAAIFFGDESGVRSDYHAGTTWAPKGETPVVHRTGQRVSCNMISAVAAKGLMRFMVTKARVTARIFIEFCRRLIKNAKRPIFLIVDGHPTHRAKVTQEFVRSTNGKLRLFFLPPYSPELNPDELVWRDVKTHKIGRHAIESRHRLGGLVVSAQRRLQKKPETIRGFFRNPTTAYVA